jgi:hypothetical protein
VTAVVLLESGEKVQSAPFETDVKDLAITGLPEPEDENDDEDPGWPP